MAEMQVPLRGVTSFAFFYQLKQRSTVLEFIIQSCKSLLKKSSKMGRCIEAKSLYTMIMTLLLRDPFKMPKRPFNAEKLMSGEPNSKGLLDYALVATASRQTTSIHLCAAPFIP